MISLQAQLDMCLHEALFWMRSISSGKVPSRGRTVTKLLRSMRANVVLCIRGLQCPAKDGHWSWE